MDTDVVLSLKKFFSSHPHFRYKKGETIIRFDDATPDYVYFLEKGFIRMFTYSHRSEEITVNIFRAYSVLPMLLYLTEQNNIFSYIAHTDIEIRRAPKKIVLDYLKNNQKIWVDLSHRFAKGLSHIVDLYLNMIETQAKDKLLYVLYLYGKRFGTKSDNHINIDLPLTIKEIASLVGLSRETVSREMDALIKKKLIIRKKNQTVIKNIDKIEGELLG